MPRRVPGSPSNIVFVLALVLASGPDAARAQGAPAFETSAPQAIVMDAETGTVLFEKGADTAFPPASLAKVMTAEMALNAVGNGDLSFQTPLRVSEYAWRTGGAPSRTATMFAAVRSEIPVEDLLKGLMVQQANDAAIIIGEGLEGTEGAFADAMNERARELGLSGSRFVNATGLPEDGQETTVRDMALLGRKMQGYGEGYGFYTLPDFEWNGIRQRNRNPLLGYELGATGIATGYTEGFGYSILGAAERDGRITLVALAGAERERDRVNEAMRLLDYGFNGFERRTIVPVDAVVAYAPVYGGASQSVPLTLDRDLDTYVPANRLSEIEIVAIFEGPLEAPVAAGDPVGRLEVRLDGRATVSYPLEAAAAVERGSFTARAMSAARELAFGWIRTL